MTPDSLDSSAAATTAREFAAQLIAGEISDAISAESAGETQTALLIAKRARAVVDEIFPSRAAPSASGAEPDALQLEGALTWAIDAADKAACHARADRKSGNGAPWDEYREVLDALRAKLRAAGSAPDVAADAVEQRIAEIEREAREYTFEDEEYDDLSPSEKVQRDLAIGALWLAGEIRTARGALDEARRALAEVLSMIDQRDTYIPGLNHADFKRWQALAAPSSDSGEVRE